MRKYFSKIIAYLILLTLFVIMPKVTSKAYGPLDVIHLYQITINPREDGTLDMHFLIDWEVLDSTTEGPLSWVQIGIPNYHVDEITAISSNIKKIKYDSDGGSYIRIDFNEKYYKGDRLTIEFTTHQSYMYFLKTNQCYYDYNPGWFDEIKVKKAIVKWKADHVYSHNADQIVEGYLYWEASLGFGETIKINVQYPQTAFNNLDSNQQFTSEYVTPKEKIVSIILVIGIIIFVIVMIIIIRNTRDPYLDGRGFYGPRYRYYHYWWHPRRRHIGGVDRNGRRIVNPNSSGFRGGGGTGGSCACACACAGGGRAGCSRKDFYHTNLQSNDVIKHLK